MKICVIGLGRWAKNHIDKLKHLDVYGGGCDVEIDYRIFIENEKPDGIVITTDSAMHSQIAIYAINKGIHVYCEKPIATTKDSLENIEQYLRAKPDVVFQGGFQMVYDPIIEHKSNNGTQGLIMTRLHGTYRAESSCQTLMIHDVAIAQYIFKEHAEVIEAWGDRSEAHAVLSYSGNRFAILHSRYAPPKFRQIEFLNKNGQLQSQSFDNAERPDLLAVSLRDWIDCIEFKNKTKVNFEFAYDVQMTIFEIEQKMGIRK